MNATHELDLLIPCFENKPKITKLDSAKQFWFSYSTSAVGRDMADQNSRSLQFVGSKRPKILFGPVSIEEEIKFEFSHPFVISILDTSATASQNHFEVKQGIKQEPFDESHDNTLQNKLEIKSEIKQEIKEDI